MKGNLLYTCQKSSTKCINDDFNWVLYLEMTNYMLNILLRDTDFITMANSLEVRVPFLDHKLVEYVFSIPGNIKKSSKIPKSLLIKPLPVVLPKQAIYRRKMGFIFPFAVWLK